MGDRRREFDLRSVQPTVLRIDNVDDERKIVAEGLRSDTTGADGTLVPGSRIAARFPQTIQRAFDQSQSIPIPFFMPERKPA